MGSGFQGVLGNHLFSTSARTIPPSSSLDDERFLTSRKSKNIGPNQTSFHLVMTNGKIAGVAAINDWSPSGRWRGPIYRFEIGQ
jgi:hypothetical protein